MGQLDYMKKIEVLKSESDLKSLQDAIISYTNHVDVSKNKKYKQISETLDSYLAQANKGTRVKEEDVALLNKKFRWFMIKHQYIGWMRARAMALIAATVIFLPLFYIVTHITPGYELFVVIPVLALMIYLLIRSHNS